MTFSTDLTDSVAFHIGYSVPEVEAVFAAFEDSKVLHVWSVVPEYDRAVYRAIYAKEKQIIDHFDDVDFDFNIIPSDGRDRPPSHPCSSASISG